MGVVSEQLRRDAVVLPEPERMHGEQAELLVGAVVSRLEARNVRRVRVHLNHSCTHLGFYFQEDRGPIVGSHLQQKVWSKGVGVGELELKYWSWIVGAGVGVRVGWLGLRSLSWISKG